MAQHWTETLKKKNAFILKFCNWDKLALNYFGLFACLYANTQFGFKKFMNVKSNLNRVPEHWTSTSLIYLVDIYYELLYIHHIIG